MFDNNLDCQNSDVVHISILFGHHNLWTQDLKFLYPRLDLIKEHCSKINQHWLSRFIQKEGLEFHQMLKFLASIPPHPTHHQLIQWNIEKQGISYYVRWLLNFSMVLKNILPLINVLPIDAPKMLFTSQIMGDNIHVVCFRKVRWWGLGGSSSACCASTFGEFVR